MPKAPKKTARRVSQNDMGKSSFRAARELPPAWAVAAVLAVSIVAVYCQAIRTPFIFDDKAAIETNQSLTSLWPLIGSAENPGPLNPSKGLPTAGRPLVNYSLAWSYHFGGLNPTGFHVVNIAIHFLSSLLLWTIVRRTLRLPYFAGRFETSAGWLATAIVLLWALHPLQTETVVYVTQRTELMVAFFYFATVYCSLRFWTCLPLPPGERQGDGASNDVQGGGYRTTWLVLAIIACLCGMASKEVMASAPLIILLFERTFVAGSVGKALRRSLPLYLGLASTWILLFLLNLGNPRADSAGFGLGVGAFEWWFTQAKVLAIYAKLTIWPWPLLIHYRLQYLTFAEASIYVVPLLVVAIATLVLLWRNDPIGFLGAFVFAILAPSTVVPILLEMAAERRMYLPLAALITLLVVGGYILAEAAWRRRTSGAKAKSALKLPQMPIVLPIIVLAIAYGAVSAKRVTAYDDELRLWQQIVPLQPANYMARSNLGNLLTKAGRIPEAIEQLDAALALKPDYADAIANLGLARVKSGQFQEAIDAFQRALALRPDDVVSLNNLGAALNHFGRFSESIVYLQHSLRLGIVSAEVHANLGYALGKVGRLGEAATELEAARLSNPNDPIILNNLGSVLTQMGRVPEATEQLERAVRIKPDYADAHNSLAIALFQTGQVPQAIAQFRRTLELKPNDFNARYNLAKVFAVTNQSEEAVRTAREAVEIARAAGQTAAAQQIDGWLKNYEREHAK